MTAGGPRTEHSECHNHKNMKESGREGNLLLAESLTHVEGLMDQNNQEFPNNVSCKIARGL